MLGHPASICLPGTLLSLCVSGGKKYRHLAIFQLQTSHKFETLRGWANTGENLAQLAKTLNY